MSFQLATADRPVLDGVRAAAATLGKAAAEDVHLLTADDLGEVFAELDRVRAELDRVSVAVVAEVDARGVADAYRQGRRAGFGSSRGSCLVEWTRRHAPGMPTSGRMQVVRLASARTDANRAAEHGMSAVESGLDGAGVETGPCLDGFAEGSLRLHRADTLLAAVEVASPLLWARHGDSAPAECHAWQARLLPLLATGSDRAVRVGLARSLSQLQPGDDAERAEVAQYACRSLSELPGPGGTTDFHVRADPVNAAVLRAAIGGLSAPVPDGDGPDPRSATQRRFDALLTVVQRGMNAPVGRDATAPVRLVVTMSLEQLVAKAERPADGPGVATDGYGHPIPAGQARRLACQAGIIPAVLGGHSEPLDLGRTARLASAGQHTALGLRDGHCTYRGCTIPAVWCVAHHLTWWSRQGRTDLDQLALLCQRHHTVVHDMDLAGEVREGHVAWQTRHTG